MHGIGPLVLELPAGPRGILWISGRDGGPVALVQLHPLHHQPGQGQDSCRLIALPLSSSPLMVKQIASNFLSETSKKSSVKDHRMRDKRKRTFEESHLSVAQSVENVRERTNSVG